VIGLASENANQRKELYEQKLGLKLAAVKFSEGEVVQKSPQLIRQSYYERNYGKSPASITPLPGADSVEEAITPFGEMIYTVEVAVEYLVQSK
jgi:hypothetical protein